MGYTWPLAPNRTLSSSALCPEMHRTQTIHEDALTFSFHLPVCQFLLLSLLCDILERQVRTPPPSEAVAPQGSGPEKQQHP